MTNEAIKVIAGVDTHADTHHVALITEYGKHLADQKFLAVGSGYRDIAEYITQYGPVIAVGVEGTGSYGAELARSWPRTASRLGRSTGPTAPTAASTASPTRSTPIRPPSPFWPAGEPRRRKAVTGTLRPCASCGPPAAAP